MVRRRQTMKKDEQGRVDEEDPSKRRHDEEGLYSYSWER